MMHDMMHGMDSCAIIIFGATGDLTKRKLIPALYRLLVARKITNVVVLGAAIDQVTADVIMDGAEQFVPERNNELWSQLRSRFYYQPLDFMRKEDYYILNERLQALEEQYNLSGNRIMYLACAASFFCTITQHSADAQIVQRATAGVISWHRIVYEKPFGHDLASAREINEKIACFFNEEQIYRIDHYLTKELVSNIALMRFTNCFFEPIWNSSYIEYVQIILSESLGIEGRGAYYDAYGALCDVVQSHILELLALIAMEPPYQLSGDAVREARAHILKNIQVSDGLLGQYEGYTHIEGVKPNSQTETFALLRMMVDTPRWQGVPFYIKTGKKLAKKETTIHIKFKQPTYVTLPGRYIESNWFTIKIVPDATFLLHINAKKPGRVDELVPVTMEFCHSCIFGERAPEEAYEILLEDVMRGEQATAVRFDEIEYAWRVIDIIRSLALPVYTYAQGSQGPVEIRQFESRHAIDLKN